MSGGQIGGPFLDSPLELVARPLERLLGAAASGADADEDGGDHRKDYQAGDVGKVELEGVDGGYEEIVEGHGRQHRGDKRRPEAAEPGGNQDRGQQHDRGIEHRLQRGGERRPRDDREQRTGVAEGLEAGRMPEYPLTDVALHLEPPSILDVNGFGGTSEYSEFRPEGRFARIALVRW